MSHLHFLIFFLIGTLFVLALRPKMFTLCTGRVSQFRFTKKFRFEAKLSETETVSLRFAKPQNKSFASFRFVSFASFR